MERVVTSVWIGFDNPSSLHEYAAGLALPAWVDYMRVALKGRPEREMPQPENVVAVRIDPHSGLLAQANQPNAIIEYFREEEIPLTDDSEPDNPNLSNSTAVPVTDEPQENLF